MRRMRACNITTALDSILKISQNYVFYIKYMYIYMARDYVVAVAHFPCHLQ